MATNPEEIPAYRVLRANMEAGKDESLQDAIGQVMTEPLLRDIWDMYASWGAINPRLQYLYSMLEVIRFWQSGKWRSVDFEEQVKENLSDMVENLDTMRKGILDDITKINLQVGSAGGGAVGQPDIVGILEPCPGALDPSSTIYRGDARYRRARVGPGYGRW